MTTKSSMKLLHAYHSAWEQGDKEGGISFYAEDVVVHMGGGGSLAGDYLSRDEFVNGWINRVAAYTDQWDVEGNDVLLVGEDGVLLLVHERWTRGNRSVSTNRLGLYRIAGEQIVECWFSDMNQPEVDEFFADLA